VEEKIEETPEVDESLKDLEEARKDLENPIMFYEGGQQHVRNEVSGRNSS